MPYKAEVPRARLPAEVVGGGFAVSVQEYTALNCKRGSQYDAATYASALAAAGTIDYIVEVGDLPMVFKGRTISFTSTVVRLETYKSPVYSGGSAVPYYNLNTWEPGTGLAVIRAGMTVTNVGTKCRPDMTLLGSNVQGNSVTANIGAEIPGLELVLQPNSTYLFRTVNGGAQCAYTSYSTWYEGQLDTKLLEAYNI